MFTIAAAGSGPVADFEAWAYAAGPRRGRAPSLVHVCQRAAALPFAAGRKQNVHAGRLVGRR